jgi:predicted kinase
VTSWREPVRAGDPARAPALPAPTARPPGALSSTVEGIRVGPVSTPAWVVAGPPGAGKSTVAARLAALLDPPPAVLDKDVMYGDLVAALLAAYGRPYGEREGEWYDEHVKVHEYAGMAATARDVRRAGCPPLLVAPFTQQIRSAANWARFEAALGGPPVWLIWVRIDAETLRRRLVARGHNRDSAKLSNYSAFIERIAPGREPGVPHVIVDNRDGSGPMSDQLRVAVRLNDRGCDHSR